MDQFLKNAPKLSKPQEIQSTLARWKNSDKKLRPILEQSELAAEAVQLSHDLSTVANWGLEAVKFLKSGKQASVSWQDEGRRILDRAQEPRAEVEIAVIPGIRKLVLAAGQLEKLKAMSAADWNRELDSQVEAAKRKLKD